jgi:hypothetical protein
MTLKPSFFPLLVLVFFVTNLVHESCHWLMGAALGFDMRFGLNSVGYLSPREPWQQALTDAAGPIATVLQAVIAYVLVMRGAAQSLFAFLYAATFMRLAAGLVSLLHPNDEARLSMFLGLGKWTLPVLVALALLVLAAKGSKRLRLGWKDQLACCAVATLAIALIIWLDRILR